MGYGNSSSDCVYIIDFGLAKKYRSSRTLQHISFKNNKKLTGTARYASINALRGVEQSRRDDFEAVGYVLMYFLRGVLPWQGLRVDKKEDRYKKIYEKKKSTTAEELCEGYPSEFCQYIKYSRDLNFEQEPDYNYLRGLFKKVADAHKFTYDNDWDWSKSRNKDSLIGSNIKTLTTITTNNTNNNNILLTNISNAPNNTIDNKLKQRNTTKENYGEKKPSQENFMDNNNPQNFNIHINNQLQEDVVNKPKKFTVNETKPKFIENQNKTKENKNNNNINSEQNNEMKQREEDKAKKDDEVYVEKSKTKDDKCNSF